MPTVSGWRINKPMKEVKAPGGSSCGDGPLALDDILFAQEAMAAICERLAGSSPERTKTAR